MRTYQNDIADLQAEINNNLVKIDTLSEELVQLQNENVALLSSLTEKETALNELKDQILQQKILDELQAELDKLNKAMEIAPETSTPKTSGSSGGTSGSSSSTPSNNGGAGVTGGATPPGNGGGPTTGGGWGGYDTSDPIHSNGGQGGSMR